MGILRKQKNRKCGATRVGTVSVSVRSCAQVGKIIKSLRWNIAEQSKRMEVEEQIKPRFLVVTLREGEER